VVCDGESVTLPDACELFTTVRDALFAFAVIVIEDALLACHVSVTLCPAPIDVLLAEKVRLGAPAFDMACDPHPVSVVKTIIAKKKKPVKRSARDFIPALVPWAQKLNHSDSELRAGVGSHLADGLQQHHQNRRKPSLAFDALNGHSLNLPRSSSREERTPCLIWFT
jgi:hypothetical protein